MSDKFDKMTIYDVDWKTTDNDGNEQVFTFKPLPFKYYPKTYDLLSKLQDLSEGVLPDEADEKLFEKISGDLVGELMELEKVMLINSYPDKTEQEIELFVSSNVFQLMEPLLKLVSRQDIVTPRQAQAAKE